jgi:hypothetical protein
MENIIINTSNQDSNYTLDSKQLLNVAFKQITDAITANEGDIQTLQTNLGTTAGDVSSLQYLKDITNANHYVYRALLTQTSTNAPVARVLNAADGDFLGKPVCAYVSPGVYTMTLAGAFPSTLTEIVLGKASLVGDGTKSIYAVRTSDNVITISTFSGVGATAANDILTDYPIEIRVRQRGTSPNIESLTTTEDGTKIIAEFDKYMNDYMFAGIEGAFVFTGNTFSAVARGTNEATLELTLTTPVVAEEPIVLDFGISALFSL